MTRLEIFKAARYRLHLPTGPGLTGEGILFVLAASRIDTIIGPSGFLQPGPSDPNPLQCRPARLLRMRVTSKQRRSLRASPDIRERPGT